MKEFLNRYFASTHSMRALQYPTYRWFILGQFVVLIGLWMTDTARSWLAYELTSDPFKLGLLAFLANAPILALGLFIGVFVDRYNRQKIVSISQFLMGCFGIILFVLSFVNGADGLPLIRYWHLMILAFVTGCVAVFDMPSRQSILVQMVNRPDLANAVAMNSMIFNLTRIIGPSLAGIVLATAGITLFGKTMSGVSVCFLMNALCFFAVSAQTSLFKLAPQEKVATGNGAFNHLREGLHYCVRAPHIGVVTLYAGLVAFLGLPYLIIMPVFARDVFGGNAATLGHLMACVGVGALIGGVRLTMVRSIETVMRTINRASVGFVCSTLTFAYCYLLNSYIGAHYMYVAYVSIAFAGMMMSMLMISCQTTVQTLVSERFRGRINAIYMFCAVGFMPVGGLLIGFLARVFGPSAAIAIHGLCLVIVALYYRHYRPRLMKRSTQTPEYRQAMSLEEKLSDSVVGVSRL